MRPFPLFLQGSFFRQVWTFSWKNLQLPNRVPLFDAGRRALLKRTYLLVKGKFVDSLVSLASFFSVSLDKFRIWLLTAEVLFHRCLDGRSRRTWKSGPQRNEMDSLSMNRPIMCPRGPSLRYVTEPVINLIPPRIRSRQNCLDLPRMCQCGHGCADGSGSSQTQPVK